MPKQLVFSRVPVELNIAEYDLTAGEDLFLSYTWELENGPAIIRDGEGPPFMHVIGGRPTETTAHPAGLRLGSWLVRADMLPDEMNSAQSLLKTMRSRGSDPETMSILQRTVNELRKTRAHDKQFEKLYRDYEIIGQQGCGDLTMNYWNVAFINNRMSRNTPKPSLVYLLDEKLELRTYSCLVKWRPVEGGVPRFSIQEVRFKPWNQMTGTNQMVWLQYSDGEWLPRGESIEFAVSSQQVIRNGQIVPLVLNCDQFSDLRHLIQLPNINPPRPLFAGEPIQYRNYSSKQREGDIWFGERQFLADEPRNLLRAALSYPVILDFRTVGDERLRGALEQAGYHETKDPLVRLVPGSWRFVPRSSTVDSVEIFFKRNVYGWTMIGLSEDKNRLICLACTGKPGSEGYKVEEAAEILMRAGAWDALLVDEGLDVFQLMLAESGQLTPMVRSDRRRLRACFIMARRRATKSAKVKQRSRR